MTSRYHGSTISGWQKNQRGRRRQEERQKLICLHQQTTTFHVNHAILYISLPSLHHYDMKLPNFASPLYGVGKHNHKNCRFLFLNIDNDRYGPKENFANICQIKWNWTRSVKFEIVRIDFKVTLPVCHPKILPPWQRDVTTSPLYLLQISEKVAWNVTEGNNSTHAKKYGKILPVESVILGSQTMKSGIHGVESRIQDCLEFPHMGWKKKPKWTFLEAFALY